MEQILIPEGVSDKLKGKMIEKTSFYVSKDDSDENHLVITFTDGTYIDVVIEHDEDDGYFLYQHIPDYSWYDAFGYVLGEEFYYKKYLPVTSITITIIYVKDMPLYAKRNSLQLILWQ